MAYSIALQLSWGSEKNREKLYWIRNYLEGTKYGL
jgi:hypothetical protein